jgi:GT2 family glycosyltransferase
MNKHLVRKNMANQSNKEPFIYIVILNWNGFEDTVECVNSLLKINYPNYIIHIIDNGSSGNDYQKLKLAFKGKKDVKVEKCNKNLGFAGGCNLGIKASLKSNASYSLLLNNDTIVDIDFLDPLLKPFSIDSEAGNTGPRICYYDSPDKEWETGKFINYFSPMPSKHVKTTKTIEVDSIVGCCMLIKNEVFKNVGVFNEEYFAYGEEDDLNYRINKRGYKIFYCPESNILHKVSASTGGEFSPTSAYFTIRNKIKFAKNILPFYYYPSYTLYLIMFFIKRATIAASHRNWQVVVSMLKGIKDA